MSNRRARVKLFARTGYTRAQQKAPRADPRGDSSAENSFRRSYWYSKRVWKRKFGERRLDFLEILDIVNYWHSFSYKIASTNRLSALEQVWKRTFLHVVYSGILLVARFSPSLHLRLGYSCFCSSDHRISPLAQRRFLR